MAKIEKNFPEKFKELKVIWKSPLIPSDPIVWRKDLADGDKAKIKDFFMTYGNARRRRRTVLAGLQWGQFKDSNDDQLDPDPHPRAVQEAHRDRSRHHVWPMPTSRRSWRRSTPSSPS